MTPKQILDSFSETLMQDERILSAQERALLTTLLQHAKAASNDNPATHAAVNAVIVSAVGETVAQRAFAILGGSIVDRILAPSARDTEVGDRTIYSMPLPVPSPSPSPQPPGVKRPPVVPSPPTPPPGHKHPHKQPLKDVPTSPQPPGHGLRPLEVKMQREFSNSEVCASVGMLEKPETLRAQCVVLDEFLAPQELEELTGYVLHHESDFQASEVISPAVDAGVIDYEHRRSRVLMDIGKHEGVIVERIKSALPLVLERLGMEEFPIASVESQITASNDGDFFREHPDDGQEEVASRHLTFVYFFHREPRQFEGGELRIHDARLQGEYYVSTGNYQTIVPQQNQIVFFPCSLLHEITPVRCSSRAFTDSRFTLNGWLRR
jgi:Rps23 Pro-64 3,4-dihydroxylase Tpa1-like proline 4-hydroxylase